MNDESQLDSDFLASVLASVTVKRVGKVQIPSPAFGPFHEAAAVLSSFDIETIRPAAGNAVEQDAKVLIPDSAPVGDGSANRRWAVQPDLRIRILRQLRESGRLSAALDANPNPPQDPLQVALQNGLNGRPLAIESQSLVELAAIRQACDWLGSAGFTDLPDQNRLERRIDWLKLLEPFEHLAGQHFRGRQKELQRLRDFVGVLPPGSVLQSARRAVEQVFSLNEKPPLVIFGPGGVGKSALVARFILDHARALELERFPFAYLDFDRPDVSAAEPLTLLIEALRQIGIEYPEAHDRCERIRQDWLNQFRSIEPYKEDSPDRRVSLAPAARSSSIRDFSRLMESIGASGRPVLLILDTFEEVQWRSAEHVSGIWKMLDELQRSLSRLRVVIAGRADVPQFKTEPFQLEGLDLESAIAYLQDRGISNPQIARQVAQRVGGSPMSLKLAADLFEHEGGDVTRNISTHEYFFFRLDDAQVQRQLYKRILGHIHNADVRKLGHPGLVLRRVTPELILEVLAVPCGLHINTLDEARALFSELQREVSLVTLAPDGSLVHRQDLRQLMLQLLQEDEPEKAEAIHEAAARYYSNHARTPGERAEEIYHRLWLNHERSVLDPLWGPEVAPFLAPAISEFSGARRAYLASKLRVEVDEETRRLANVEDWELIVERKVQDLLRQGQLEEALQLLGSRPDRTVASPLVPLEGTILSLLNRRDEALDVLDRGFQRAFESREKRQATILLLQSADLVTEFADTKRIPPVSAKLEALAQASLPPEDRVAILARQTALSRLEDRTNDETRQAKLAKDLRKAFDSLDDATLTAQRTLAWRVSSFFSEDDAARMSRVLRLSGFPRESTALRDAAAKLTSFDVAISQESREEPGMIARKLQVPIRGSLTASWTEFLLTGAEASVKEILRQLVDEFGGRRSPGPVEALAGVMRAATTTSFTGAAQATPSSVSLSKTAESPRANLTAATQKRLADALQNAFPSVESLKEFLLFRLDVNLDAITASGSLAQMASSVVLWAVKQGSVLDLVVKALEARPDNPTVREVASELGVSTPVPDTPLEKIITPFFVDVATFTRRVGLISAQVCRVEVGLGNVVYGTGFLVGVNLLLTADHVLADVHSGRVKPSEVRLRFDLKTDRSGETLTEGTLFELEQDWLVARSEFGDQPSQLGYALLRVRNSPGAQPIGAERVESEAAIRRWIEIGEGSRQPQIGDGLILLQHPNAGSLKLSLNPNAVIASDPNGKSIRYEIDSEPGSSGSPCFSMDLQLAALHIGRPAGAEKGLPPGTGVLISAILRDLQTRGMGGLIGTIFR
jgi:hypothetical protein